LGRERAGQRDEIGLRQHAEQAILANDLVGRPRALGRIAPGGDHPHVEGLGKRGQPRADAAQTGDHQRLAAELVFALRDVTDHAPPFVRDLVVARLRNLPRHGEDQGDGMLGDRALVYALRAGDANAGRAQRVAGILVGAGADRLDEGEPGRRGNQFVPPQPGAQQHVHLADARLQIVEAAHLEPVNAGVAQSEAFTHAISDVGETYDQLVFGRERTRAHGIVIAMTNIGRLQRDLSRGQPLASHLLHKAEYPGQPERDFRNESDHEEDADDGTQERQ
jgi:hypothetical protein